ncbi:MAG TPA: TraB/GumN family protein [Flavobacterium sp.]|nr:TraB/GumN family protein [Flavobacterium sp.]
MKNLIRPLFTFLALAAGFAAAAQLLPKENSLLWEVSGNGLKSPSYLYGTVHMICEKDYVMKDKATKAFEKTAVLALEVNVSDPKEMAAMQQSVMGKSKLSNVLTAAQQKELNETLQKSGLTLHQLDSYSLFAVMSILSMQSFGCSDYKMYEMEFAAKAKERNMPVIGLETIQSQFDIVNNAYTTDEMISYLKTISAAETQKLVADYIKEDINAIYSKSADPETMNERTKAMMLDSRNSNWIEKMPGLMKNGSVFFAIGAAHLPGDTGIIYLLRKAGYTVKPVMQ